MTDTIVALSTPPGVSGVAVIRLSGSQSYVIGCSLTGLKTIIPREVKFSKFKNQSKTIDEGLVIFFKAPHSFTGEDIIELQCHGSRAVIDSLINYIIGFNNTRLAQPGEFTRRAFYNNKLDLTESEALADLLEADTELQRQQALLNYSGKLKDLCQNWKEDLLQSMAFIESVLDFSDEELDLDNSWLQNLSEKLKNVSYEIEQMLTQSKASERLRTGFKVVISGAPNVGKSSLINALSKREVAIVTDIAGTTRDIIDVQLNIEGYPVIVSDTAGLRDTTDIVEKHGIDRAKKAIADADIHIAVTDKHEEILGDIKLFNKIDLNNKVPKGFIGISAQTGEGLDKLHIELLQKLKEIYKPTNSPKITHQRQYGLFEQVNSALKNVIIGIETKEPLELLAEDLRYALHNLGLITGTIDVEEMLDALFGQFCIGK